MLNTPAIFNAPLMAPTVILLDCVYLKSPKAPRLPAKNHAVQSRARPEIRTSSLPVGAENSITLSRWVYNNSVVDAVQPKDQDMSPIASLSKERETLMGVR